MASKKDRMKTSKLSSTVLDYYYKYGQNRDLEKYLRLKQRNSSKSSSDSSLKNYDSSNFTMESKRTTKSLEKLDSSDGKTKSKDDLEKPIGKSTENLNDPKGASKQKDKPDEKTQIKFEKKTQQQIKGKSKSKSYNLNMESSIEINLPSSSSVPTLSTPIIDSIPKANRILQLESCETQTDDFLCKETPKIAKVAQVPQPESVPTTSKIKESSITAIEQKSKNELTKPTEGNITDVSPTSSVASAKVRLEWDSMADIGYNRIIDFKSQSNSNLNTFEKSALTKFFAKRGLNFDDNLVILAPADHKSPLQKRDFTQSAIEMRDARRIRKEIPKLSPATNKMLWERALAKYREKYGQSKSDATSGIDSTQFMSLSTAPHHSTPLTINANESSKASKDHLEQSKKARNDGEFSKPNKVKTIEKWCQTSSIDVEAIGVQVEPPHVSLASKSVQIEIEYADSCTQKDDENLTTATSFEFLAPNAYANQEIPKQRDSMTSSTIGDIPNREDDKQENVYTHEENPDDKENIPPIEDKENIPPPPLHSMRRPSDQPSVFKTPEKSLIDNQSESSMLPNDLQKGVDLLNALIDSREMDGETKKKLIRKIVRHLVKSKDTKDITQMIMSFSDKSCTKISGVTPLSDVGKNESGNEKTAKDTISGISTLSSSESALSEANKVPETEQNDQKVEKVEKEIKEWLLPITQSEIKKENARKSQIILQTEPIPEEQPEIQKTHDETPLTKNNGIFEFLENEKKTHFNWIDQEIEHLNNLKLLLQNINSNDSDDSKGNVSEEKINSVYAKHNRDFFTIYENFRRSTKNMSANGSQADVSSALIDSSKSSDESSRFMNRGKMGSKSHWVHKTTLESPSSSIASSSKVDRDNKESLVQKTKCVRSNKLPEWDSHLNMQQLVKNRTKLKTPNSDESIEAYAKACREKFDRKCAKTKDEPNKKALRQNSARDQPIYTKPYSSDSYSDIQNNRHSNEAHVKRKSNINSDRDAYTSVSGSDGFLSPNSISIGVAANSTSNTTTHQYDTKISVGLQTTNTLERMPIIQLKKSADVPLEVISHDQPTVRVNKLTINRQLQVRPESLAYIIMFKEDANSDENSNSKAFAQECGNHLYDAKGSKVNNTKNNSGSSISGNSNSTSESMDPNRNNKRKDEQKTTKSRNIANSNSSSLNSFENLTLQECLQARRPDFYANAEQRRKCLNDLHNLRQQRNEQRKKLLAANVCLNAKTLNRNMKRLLPPPPLAQIRIFKTREIKSRTRRKYQKLPEILKRQQLERDMKIRRNHRILVNTFSKNLQKHVLKGKTDLSNSMMIN